MVLGLILCGPLAAETDGYLAPPRAGSFGYGYSAEPVEREPEKELWETPENSPNAEGKNPEERKNIAKKQAQKNKTRFNREFRLGLGLETQIALPNSLRIGGLKRSETKAPAPFLLDPRLTNAEPLSRLVPLLHNTYRFSLILHISQFFELSFGLGYQSDSSISKLNTVGARKSYLNGSIKKKGFYAIQYQKDSFFGELDWAVLLPWVLSAKARMVLGLRLSGSVALGVLLKESLALAKPELPNALSLTNLDPSPTYQNIKDYFLRSRKLRAKLSLSVGGYFELVGFRLHLAYALSYFPDGLYPEARYYILQNFAPGEPIQYSSFGFPKAKILHSLHLSLQYFINPSRLFRPSQQKKRPPKREPRLRSRIG